jgi:hypothetical protein
MLAWEKRIVESRTASPRSASACSVKCGKDPPIPTCGFRPTAAETQSGVHTRLAVGALVKSALLVHALFFRRNLRHYSASVLRGASTVTTLRCLRLAWRGQL